MSGWRELPFFGITPVIDPSLFSEDLTAITPANDTVLYSSRREIRQFDKELNPLLTSAIEDGWTIDFLRGVPNTFYFVSVASKQGEPAIVTVWNMGKMKATGPSILSRIKVKHNEFPITTFAMASDVSVMVFGYADGAVIVVRGDVLHDRGARQRLVYNAPTAITGLEFVDDEYSNVFVASLSQIATVSTLGKPPTILEKSKGADLGCVTSHDNQLIVAREKEICHYTAYQRGPAIEFACTKKSIRCYKHYLVIVSQEHSLLGDPLKLIIVDIKNSIIAYQGHLAVKHIFVQWDRLNVLGPDSVLYILKEKSPLEQLNILKEQQLFKTALSMTSGIDTKEVLLLHQDYADFLQERGDQEGALTHYIESIKLGNTSHVILRYKDSHKVTHLATYLEKLAERGLAKPEHMTLLVICYANMHDYEKLSNLVSKSSDFPDFDFESTIQVCRKSNYFNLAARLAQIWPDPDLVVQIKLEMNDAKGCLDYIFTVSVADALRILTQNSRSLLNKLPVETTAVLISLFTGKFVQRPPEELQEPEKETKESTVVAPVLQSYQAFMSYLTTASYLGSNLVNAETLQEQKTPTYLPPNPRLIFPSFIGHENEFVIFLEACLDAAADFQPSQNDLAELTTALYETYLSAARSSKDSSWNDKAALLLDNHRHLADSLAVKLANITLAPELTAVGGSSAEKFRDFIQAQKIDEALALLESNPEPETLLLAVKYFVSEADAFEKIRPNFTELLNKCVQLKVLSPVQIINLVSRPHITIQDLRPFLENHIKNERAEIDRNSKLTKSYREETESERRKLDSDLPVVKYSDCAGCGLPLDLPVVHFACKHSYHQRCSAGSGYCRICAPEQQSVEAIRRSQLEAAKEDVFVESLASHSDKLRVITDYISQGALT